MYMVYYSATGNVTKHYSFYSANFSARYAYDPSDCVWFVPNTFDYDGNSLLLVTLY